MGAAVQLRSDFLGDDLPRTARKSEEAAQTRQLLALAVIRDGVLRFKVSGAEALVTRKAPAKTPILTDEHRTALAAGRSGAGGAGGTGRPGQSSDAGTGPSRHGGRPGGRQALRLPAARRTGRRGHEAIEAFNKTSVTSSTTSAPNGAASR